MKYLLSAVSILAALLLGLLIAPLLTPRPIAMEGSLVVNQKIFQPQELAERLKTTPYHFDSKGELLTDLIYRELLLQEAKAQKINTERAFLTSMRDFYEQSMIKTLLDRQCDPEKHLPSAEQISALQPFLTKRFQLTRYDYPGHQSALDNRSAQIQEYDLAYLDLPEDARSALLELKGGALSPPFHSSAGWFRLQLTNITPLETDSLPTQIEQKELCRTELQRQSIQNWIVQLYRKSNIQMPATRNRDDNG